MYDFLVFHSVFRLFHDFLLFHLLFSSLLFSSLFFASLFSPSPLSSLVSFSSFLFLFLFLFFFSFLQAYAHDSENGTLSEKEFQHLSETFHLVLFWFIFSVFFLCLLSLSSFCVCRRVCRCVVWCGVVCAVWCGTLRTPCVDSKRLRVYIQTRAHGGHRQFCLPRKSPRKVITCFRCSPKVTTGCCPRSSLRTDREQHDPDSSNHSLCLLSSSYCGESLEGTSREMVRFVFRSNEKSITNDLRVSIS